MKAEELMVGDWVLLFDKTPVKVDCIGNAEAYLTEPRGQHDLDWRVNYEHIKPIHITPEILEKNGFKDMGFYSECKIGDWRVLCDTKNVAILHREHCNIDTPVEYIHDLQHALRLCRIDKEIEL